MPMILNTTAVAAGAINQNVISGSAFEFARSRQVVSIGVAQSATGGFVSINAGADVIAEEFEPPIKTVYPIIPDEMYFTDVMEQGDRLRIPFRNPTGGSLTLRTVCQFSPM